ncbi:MAG: IS1182 family transposase [Bacteroidales bacterium]|nr:IS1182 family transposase [Bacteroidales bacterium]
MHHIQGQARNQFQLVCLEQMVAPDSFVRVIDVFVDAIDLKSFGFSHAVVQEEGRPPYNPAVLLKLYIYGYKFGVRSSRKLEYQAATNLEVRWLLNEQTPSNRTISAFRKTNAMAFRKVFRKFVFMLRQADLIGGETIAIDSFKVRGQNSLKNNFNEKKIKRHLVYIDARIDEFANALDQADQQEEKEELKGKISLQKQRREKYEKLQKDLNDSGQEQISTTDPDAKAVILHRGVVNVGYTIQASVDAKHKLIAETETGDVNDTRALAPVAIATKETLKVEGFNVLADKGYHTGDQLSRCEVENIVTFVSPKEPASNDVDIFPISRFVYQPETNTYLCPANETLATNGTWYAHSSRGQKAAFRFQRYNTPKCKGCTLRTQCTKGKDNGRSIDRSEFAAVIDANNQRVNANPDYYKLRQQLAEHPWGTMKRQWGFDHVLVKGKERVMGEVSLVFTAYNLTRVLAVVGGIEGFKALLNKFSGYFQQISALFRAFKYVLKGFRPEINLQTELRSVV